ncbi:MAG TPA: hypothetical protein VL966_10985 [Alphaproteobacteria bacterium]|jgi:hypothetical protein|nr:hypothetical protein [Alphaproteobacteria bacterium]
MNAMSRAFPVFAIVYAVVYALAFPYDWQLFAYYPAVGEFHFAAQPPTLGPPINWYGWMVTAAIAGVVAAVLSIALPARWNRALATLAWVVPVACIAYLMYLARVWFI